jgi:hypothetical protein
LVLEIGGGVITFFTPYSVQMTINCILGLEFGGFGIILILKGMWQRQFRDGSPLKKGNVRHSTLLSATAFDPPGLSSLTTTSVVPGKIEPAARRANPTAHGIAGVAGPRAFRRRSGVRDRERQIANAVSVK